MIETILAMQPKRTQWDPTNEKSTRSREEQKKTESVKQLCHPEKLFFVHYECRCDKRESGNNLRQISIQNCKYFLEIVRPFAVMSLRWLLSELNVAIFWCVRLKCHTEDAEKL